MFECGIDAIRHRDPSGFLTRTAAAQERASPQSGGECVARGEEAEQVPLGPPTRLSREDTIREDASITFQAAAAALPHAPTRLAIRTLHSGVCAFPQS